MSALSLTAPAQIYRFNRHDRITINGVSYTCYNSDAYGHEFQRTDGTNICETFTHYQIEDLLRTNKMTVDRQFFSPQAAHSKVITHGLTWEDLTDQEKNQIIWRKEYCDHFLRMEAQIDWVCRSEDAMKRAIAEIQDTITRQDAKPRSGTAIEIIAAPTWTTLLRWINKYENGGFDKMMLMSGRRRSGNDDDRLSSEVRDLVKNYAKSYLDRREPSVVTVYNQLKTRIDELNAERNPSSASYLKAPSIRTLYREVEQLDPFHVAVGRDGIEAAQKKFFITHSGLKNYRPLGWVQMDDWKVHLHTLLERSDEWRALNPEVKSALGAIRCNLTYAIDAATRCIVGANLTIEGATLASALRCLQMIVSDKTSLAQKYGCKTPWKMHGSPEVIVTDGGSNFIAPEFKAAALAICTQPEVAIGGIPELRGTIERSFRTIDQSLMPYFTGRTFSNVTAKGNYDSQKDASISVKELGNAMIRWIVDVYHNSPHAGLNFKTPYNAWLEATRECGIEVAPPYERIRHIFGTTIQRKIGGRGIRFLNVHYQSEPLQKIRREAGQRRVSVRIDQDNMGEISVKGNHGWISVPAADDGMNGVLKGVSVPMWLETAAHLRRLHAAQADLSWPIVADAIRDIKAMSDRAIKNSGLSAPVIGAEELNKADRELNRTFRIRAAYARATDRTDDADYDDIDVSDDPSLDGDLETPPEPSEAPSARSSRKSPEPLPPANSTAGDEDDWSVE